MNLLANEFGCYLDQGIAWIESRKSFVVRYETLHDNPREVLLEARDYFGLEFVMATEDAIAGAHKDLMRLEGPDVERHIRSGRVGDWREHLSMEHLRIFRSRHAARLARLGYQLH